MSESGHGKRLALLLGGWGPANPLPGHLGVKPLCLQASRGSSCWRGLDHPVPCSCPPRSVEWRGAQSLASPGSSAVLPRVSAGKELHSSVFSF